MAYIGRDIEYGSFTKQTLTANSSTTVFALDQSVFDANGILVSVGGVIQEPDVAYTASGTVLTFTGTPVTGDPIWIVYLGKTLGTSTTRDAITYQAATGNGSATTVAMTSTGVTGNIVVTLNGVMQTPSTDFSVSGSTLTFTTAPFNNAAIGIHYLGKQARIGVPASGTIQQADLASSGTFPAWDGSALTGIVGVTKTDIFEIQNNIALLNFLRANDITAKRTSMLNGFQDQFRTEDGIVPFNGTLAVSAFGDSSSSGHTVTAVGNTVVSSENVKFGSSSMYFDGSGDSLTVADSADFDFGTGDVTIEVWVNSANPTQDRIITRGSHPTEWFLRSDSTASEAWKCNIGGTVRNMNTGSNEWADGKWHHVAVCRDGATLRLYVDGVQKDSQACGTGTWNASSGQLVSIGTGANAGPTEYYHGFLDEVRISKTCRYPSGTTFTPSTTIFTSDANTELLVHSNYNNTQTQVAQSTGTIIASIGTGANAAGRLFDGNRTGTNHSGAGANDYAGKDWGNGVTKTITGFKAWNNENTHGFNVGGANIEAKLQGSSNGSSWTDLGTTGSVADGAGQPIPFSIGKMGGITTTTAYRYHRVLFNNTTDIRWNEIEFYEGTPTEATFTDSSSNTHAITVVGDAKHQPVITKFGTDAVYYDGYGAGNGNTYLQVTDHADFDFGTDDFTIETWAYQTASASGGANYHAVWHTSDVDGHGINCIWHNDGTLEFHFGTGSWSNYRTTTTYSNNQWHHIAESRSGGTVKIFVNGVEVQSLTRNGTYDGNQSLKFGGWRPVANGAEILGNTFQGYMDEMRISNNARYTSAFTPSSSAFTSDANTLLLIHSEEIAYAAGTGSSQLTYSNNTYSNYSGAHNLEIMTKGTDDLSEVSSPSSAPSKGHIEVLINDRLALSDSSSSAHAVTSFGDAAISTTQKKIGTHSIKFDGTGDYISVADHDDWEFGTNDWTIEAWIKTTSTSKGVLGWSSSGSWSGIGIQVGLDSSGTITARAGKNGGTGVTLTTSGSINNDAWHHFAFVRNGASFKVYIDGTSTASASDNSLNLTSVSSDWYFGQQYTGETNRMTGYMDEIRISDSARYTANFTPSTTAFTSDANTKLLISADERYATINTDIKGEMSRDGGTTWSPATLIRVDKVIAGSYYDVFMGDVDFTGDPSGTNIKGRIKTVNQNQVTVKGMAVNWQ